MLCTNIALITRQCSTGISAASYLIRIPDCGEKSCTYIALAVLQCSDGISTEWETT